MHINMELQIVDHDGRSAMVNLNEECSEDGGTSLPAQVLISRRIIHSKIPRGEALGPFTQPIEVMTEDRKTTHTHTHTHTHMHACMHACMHAHMNAYR